MAYASTSPPTNQNPMIKEEILPKEEPKTALKEELGSEEIPTAAEPMEAAPSAVVASHYNALPELGLDRRNDSRILRLRNLNNWMKSMLIGDFLDRLNAEGCRRARVLDLACGKGGDLRKWRIGNIAECVMTDIAEVSLQDGRDRFQRLADRRTGRTPFRAHFVQADLTEANLRSLLPAEAPTEFDVASCQFALHYSFRSEQCARRMLQNCTEMLRAGGYFIGTVTNACAIMHYIRNSGGHFSNQVCTVSADWPIAEVPPLFGAEIQFHLEGVVNCPEYLCYFPLLKKLLEELGLELVYEYDFPAAIDHYLKERGREAMDLMRRMDALEAVEKERHEGKDAGEYGPAIAKLNEGDANTVGTISKSEWEVLTMYKVFAFRKLQSTATAASAGADVKAESKPELKSDVKNGRERSRSPL